jgi:hypothetical protein
VHAILVDFDGTVLGRHPAEAAEER